MTQLTAAITIATNKPNLIMPISDPRTHWTIMISPNAARPKVTTRAGSDMDEVFTTGSRAGEERSASELMAAMLDRLGGARY